MTNQSLNLHSTIRIERTENSCILSPDDIERVIETLKHELYEALPDAGNRGELS